MGVPRIVTARRTPSPCRPIPGGESDLLHNAAVSDSLAADTARRPLLSGGAFMKRSLLLLAVVAGLGLCAYQGRPVTAADKADAPFVHCVIFYLKKDAP